MGRALSLAAACAVIVAIALAATANAAFPGANGRIVFGMGDVYSPLGFTRIVPQPHETLFTAKVDGSDVRQLSDGKGLTTTRRGPPTAGTWCLTPSATRRTETRSVG
jgi:hypothetical protein